MTAPAPRAADAPPRLAPPLLAAIERGLADVLRLDRPADLVLRGFFRANARLGRRDRGEIAETAFDVLRHRRRYGHLAQSMRGPLVRRLAWLSLVSRHGDALVPALGAGDDDAAALRRAVAVDPATLPPAVRLSLPDWLYESLVAQASDDGPGGDADAHDGERGPSGCDEELGSGDRDAGSGREDAGSGGEDARSSGAAQGGPDERRVRAVERLGLALLEPAALDLRTNLLKTDRDALRAALEADGIGTEPLAACATALRVHGKPALERTAAFASGAFEVQDVGSQRLVEFAAPRRGQTVVDFCAGAGGKTLALAALMRSTGQVYACDVSAARLRRLGPRLARSGATNVQPFGLDSEHDPKLRRLAARADLVLVDAPCSGTGTLRRNPELKWRMDPRAIDALCASQASILQAAARLVRRGGALVYATCSLLRRENEAVVEAFSEAGAGWSAPVIWRVRPDIDRCDGFFAARWIRTE